MDKMLEEIEMNFSEENSVDEIGGENNTISDDWFKQNEAALLELIGNDII